MGEGKESFVFYKSFYDAIKKVPEECQLELYNAILSYSLEGKEIENLSPIAEAMFILIKPNIDSSQRRYEASVNNGKKGGRPKEDTQEKPNNNLTITQEKPSKNPEETQEKPSKNLNDNVDVDDNVNDNEDKDVNVDENKKIHFAEFVTMTNAEKEKLISTYGEEFANQCITVLDNYKGSKGKKYKSDYRAILSWVVEKVKKEYPQLLKQKPFEYKENILTEEEYFKNGGGKRYV